MQQRTDRSLRPPPWWLLGVLLCALPGLAHGTGSSLRLAVVRTPDASECIDAVALARAVSERLGRRPFDDGAERSLEVLFTRAGEQWAGELFLRQGEGPAVRQRRFESSGRSCAALGGVVTLAVTLLVDPTAQAGASATPPPPPPARREPAPSPPRLTPRAAVLLRSGLSVGLVPGSTASLTAGVAVFVHPVVSLDLGAGWLFARPSFQDPAWSFGAGVLHAGVCASLWHGLRGSVALCGALWAGLTVPTSAAPLEAAAPQGWGGLSAMAQGRVWIARRLALEALVGALSALPRHEFVEEDGARPGSFLVLSQASPVTFWASLGVGLAIW